jgi:hypothetical protein
MRTLVLPPAAQRDEDAIQMLSAWIAENGLHCTLNIGMWKAQGHNEPEAWGVLLADVVRHVADAIQQDSGTPSADTIETVLASLTRELDEPTSKVKGDFAPGHS